MTSYLPSWESVTRAVNAVYGIARDINPATLSGAIDVVVVQRDDGTLVCSPFHVRFGKLKLLMPSEKAVEVIVNGTVTDLPMKVGDAGEAFFVVETSKPVPKEYMTSPIALPTKPGPQAIEPLSLDGQLPGFQSGSPLSPDDGPSPSTAPTEPLMDPLLSFSQAESESAFDRDAVVAVEDQIVSKLFKSDEEQEAGEEFASASSLLAEQRELDRYPLSDNEMDRLRPETRPNTRGMLSDTEHEPVVGSPPDKNWSWTWGALPTKKTSTLTGEDGERSIEAAGEGASLPPALHEVPSSPVRDDASSLASPRLSAVMDSPRSAALSDHMPLLAVPGPPSMSVTDIGTSISSFGQDDDDGLPSLKEFRVDMSLCGQPENLPKLSKEEAILLFRKNAVSFDDFCQNPAVLSDPNLVVRINNQYYSWSVAAPMIACRAIYGYDLPDDVLADLVAQQQKKASVSAWRGWWSRSSTSSAPPAPAVPASVPPASPPMIVKQTESPPPLSPPLSAPPSPQGSITVVRRDSAPPPEEEEHTYAKTLRLTSDQLKSLNLQKGLNTVSFVVRSTLQGTATTNARIFLLDQGTKIVISDVDGTITKSDALGHIFTMVGRDWTHTGVAGLYTAIHKNGYQMLYLTSRAIGQASYTRDYLKKVEQGRFQLPDGPVIMSPDRLFKSFHREVILKKPQEFKMAVLRDIKKLFGDTNPFYAGFGNRITDALSYRSVGIPPSRIFTIDPAGDVKLELMPTYKSTYLSLNELAEYLFPPLLPSSQEDEEYSDLNYWRQPVSRHNVWFVYGLPADGSVRKLPEIDSILEIGDGNEEEADEEEFDQDEADGRVDMV